MSEFKPRPKPAQTPASPRDLRQSVLEKIEAALRAQKISVVESGDGSAGSDPYNTGRASGSPWGQRKR